jgi:hypothetical protein
MKRFIEGADREQATLLPDCLDDWIDESNPVRAVDVFVDGLDLAKIGFDGVVPRGNGPAWRTHLPQMQDKFHLAEWRAWWTVSLLPRTTAQRFFAASFYPDQTHLIQLNQQENHAE